MGFSYSLFVYLGLVLSRVSSWTSPCLTRYTRSCCSSIQKHKATRAYRAKQLVVSTGWIDDILPSFLKNRKGDFLKLEETQEAYGPGPLLLLYNVPTDIDDLEIFDIIHDGAPKAFSLKPKVFRVNDDGDSILDLPLKDALEQIANGAQSTRKNLAVQQITMPDSGIVLFFSGFLNSEMMNVYNILGQEIYQEVGGKVFPACAKCVPKAMEKPLRQVLSEVIGDHEDAVKISTQ